MTQAQRAVDAVVPTCVGCIMDGNRRWAKAHDQDVRGGHAAGYETLKQVVSWCKDMGVRHLVVYAFSTENWNRGEREVGCLLDLMRTVLRTQLEELRSHDVAVHVVGDIARFPEDLQSEIAHLHETNPTEARYHLWACTSYGGRAELVAAAQRLVEDGVTDVTEDSFSEALWTADMPDPDLIIRTGGQQRLSNFLPWQSTYSELFFLDLLWPDLDRTTWNNVLHEFAQRKRNYGR